jgi:hypothetical protein
MLAILPRNLGKLARFGSYRHMRVCWLLGSREGLILPGEEGLVRRRIGVAGWSLLALAVVAVAVIVITGALRAHGDAAFNRWVGWATIAAVPLAAVGLLLVVWDKIAPSAAPPDVGIGGVEDELAAVLLAQAQVTRSRLIGAGEAGDRAANVRFVKGGSRFREVGGADEGDLATVLEYYRSLAPGRLVVLGEPGAGKTVLAVELLIRLLEHRQGDKGLPVPVLVSAAAYDTRLAWEQWLAGHLTLRFNISAVVAARLVRDGRILALVDGVDEIGPAAGEAGAGRAGVLVAALNSWMRGRERAPVVVTCRRAQYESLARGVDRATHVEMVSLSGGEAARYLREQFLGQDEERRWEPVLAALHFDPDGPLVAQLATPWRLTLALAAFRSGGDPAGLLPAAPAMTGVAVREYVEGVDSLLLGLYVPAAVRLHDLAGRYTPQDVQRWLTALADGLAWQARHGRSATDIRLDQWWEPTGRRVTRLTHIALAALPVLPWLVAGTVTGHSWLAGAGGSTLGLAATAGWSPSPKRLRLREVTTSRGIGRLTGGLAVGLTLGLTGGLAVGLTLGLTGGLAVGLAFGLTGAFVDSSPQAIGPRDVIRADGRYRLAFGLAVGLAGGLAGGLGGGLAGGLAGALTTGLTFGLAFGLTVGLTGGLGGGLGGGLTIEASAWTRYYVSVVINAARQRGPLRFGAFLDWAQQAGLLRVSGITYQFRHRQLQDWLTSYPDYGRRNPTPRPSNARDNTPNDEQVNWPPAGLPEMVSAEKPDLPQEPARSGKATPTVRHSTNPE